MEVTSVLEIGNFSDKVSAICKEFALVNNTKTLEELCKEHDVSIAVFYSLLDLMKVNARSGGEFNWGKLYNDICYSVGKTVPEDFPEIYKELKQYMLKSDLKLFDYYYGNNVNYEQLGHLMGLSTTTARKNTMEAVEVLGILYQKYLNGENLGHKIGEPIVKDSLIKTCGLSSRLTNALVNSEYGIVTVEDVLKIPSYKIMALRSLGTKTMDELLEFFRLNGFVYH